MLIEEGHDAFNQILKRTEIRGLKNITYDYSGQGDEIHMLEDALWGSNHSIFQIMSGFLCLQLISLSRENDLLEV